MSDRIQSVRQDIRPIHNECVAFLFFFCCLVNEYWNQNVVPGHGYDVRCFNCCMMYLFSVRNFCFYLRKHHIGECNTDDIHRFLFRYPIVQESICIWLFCAYEYVARIWGPSVQVNIFKTLLYCSQYKDLFNWLSELIYSNNSGRAKHSNVFPPYSVCSPKPYRFYKIRERNKMHTTFTRKDFCSIWINLHYPSRCIYYVHVCRVMMKLCIFISLLTHCPAHQQNGFFFFISSFCANTILIAYAYGQH